MGLSNQKIWLSSTPAKINSNYFQGYITHVNDREASFPVWLSQE
mgnify:CR=1 FL=1